MTERQASKLQTTLSEWEAATGERTSAHPNGARYIPDRAGLADRTGLFRLTDYVVSSVIGGTIWLIRRGSLTGATR